MAQRWYVYRDNETLGPFDSHEVRAALRSGDLDPFDKIGLEGSTLQRPLLDVDEIFLAPVEPVQRSADAVARQPLQVAELKSDPKNKLSEGYLSGAVEKNKDQSNIAVVEFVKNYKSFYILAQNNIYGPHTYQEILDMHQRGIVPQGAKIKKNGYAKAVSLDVFVQSYSNKKRSNSHSAQIIALPNKKKLIVLNNEARGLRWLAIAIVIFSLVFALAMYVNNQQELQKIQLINQLQNNSLEPDSNQPFQSEEAVVNPIPTQTTSPKITTRPSFPRSEVKRELKPYVSRPSRVSSPKTTPQTVIKKSNRPKQTPINPPRVNQANPIRKSSASKISQEINTQNLGLLPSNLSERDGDELLLGPLAFNKEKLQACPNKCMLAFVDRNGKSIVGIFFKGAYLERLMSKKSSTLIQGTISDGGRSIILQELR